MAGKSQKRYTEEDLPAPGLFEEQPSPGGPLTVFQAQLLSSFQTDWTGLFSGFEKLQAITFQAASLSCSASSSASPTPKSSWAPSAFFRASTSYSHRPARSSRSTLADALADHKALTEVLASQLDAEARPLLPRVLDGSLRFRLLRGRPSHEKLYLLSGPAGHRVLTGSANLSFRGFEARQQEIYVSFEDATAWNEFQRHYQRDYAESCAIDADLLVVRTPDGAAAPRTGPVELLE